MDSILSNETWELSELPFGYKPIGCKWVFKKKLRPDGTIDKYKTRLVAKDYTQRKAMISLILIHLLLNDHYLSATFSSCFVWSSRSSNGREDNFS
jgi:hypothetical protein